jgi:hypothetical protein
MYHALWAAHEPRGKIEMIEVIELPPVSIKAKKQSYRINLVVSSLL